VRCQPACEIGHKIFCDVHVHAHVHVHVRVV
jgi:hypothetical protein